MTRRKADKPKKSATRGASDAVGKSVRRRIWLLGGLAVALGAVIVSTSSVYRSDVSSLRKLPAPNTDGMEAPVAARIRDVLQSVRRESTSDEAWGRMGMVFQAHGLWDDALVCYEEAARLDDGDYRWQYFPAMMKAERDPAAAVSALRRALDRTQPTAAMYVRLGEAHAATDDALPAGDAYKAALRIDPRSAHALLGLGQLALKANDLDRAVERLQSAVQLIPGFGQAHLALSAAYRRAGDADLANQHAAIARQCEGVTLLRDPLVTAVGREGVSSVHRVGRGVLYAEAGRSAEAIEEFKAALELKPGDFEVCDRLGLVYLSIGRAQEAEPLLRRVVELTPADPRAHCNLGLSLAQVGRLDEALGYYVQAAGLRPDDERVVLGLADVLHRLGRFDEAAERYRGALRIAPDNGEAHFNFAILLLGLETDDSVGQAVEQLRTAVRLLPTDARVRFRLAEALRAAGQTGEAGEHYRATLAIDPDHQQARTALESLEQG